MPEGHTVHRIARQFDADLVGHRVAVSSPQGRFADGAALLDGAEMTTAAALGKHLFLGFGTAPAGTPRLAVGGLAPERWLHVHLGLYGAWDFHGRVSAQGDGGAVGSLGAPRRAIRMGEGERALPAAGGRTVRDSSAGVDDEEPEEAPLDEPTGDLAEDPGDGATFPPPPVGQVRVRLATAATVADLRGAITCEVLTPDDVADIVAKAGPDPRVDAWPDPEAVVVRAVRRRRVAVGQLLMDQSVVSGIGNIYRAELLFRARLEPHTPGAQVPEEVLAGLWRDWVALLDDGIRVGAMLTREELGADGDPGARALALADPSLRHAVYGRAGEPCLRCGATVLREQMAGRTLYWCPACQV